MDQVLFLNRVRELSLRVLAFLVPLWFLPFTQDVLNFQKRILLVILVTIAAVAWLAKTIKKGELNIGFSWLSVLILAVVVTTGISAFLSLWPYGSFWGWPFNISDSFITIFFLTLLCLLVSHTVQDQKELIALFTTFICAVIIAGIYSMLQLYRVFIIPLPFTKTPSFNTIGSITGLGILAAALLPISLAIASMSKSALRWQAWTLTILLLTIVLITNSFNAWIVLTIELLFLLGFGFWKLKQMPSSNWLPFAQALLVVSLFFLIFKFSLPGSPQTPLEVTPSKGAQISIVKNVLQEKPIFGSGPSTFVFDYSKHRQASLNQTVFWGTRFTSGASHILDWFATKGIIGGIAFIALLGVAVFFMVKLLLKSRDDYSNWILELGLLASLAGMAAAKIIYFSNFTLDFFFWLLLGAVGMLLMRRKNISLASPSFLSVSFSFIFLLVLILGLGLWFIEGQKYFAEARYFKGAQLLGRGESQKAIDKIISAINLNPSLDLYWRDLSQMYLSRIIQIAADKNLSDEQKQQEIQSAVTNATLAANQATVINPSNVENWNVRGFVYRNLLNIEGAFQAAVESYQKASVLEPASPFSFTELGRVYLTQAQSLAGQKDKDTKPQQEEALGKSLESLNKALELKADYSPAHYLIALVYVQQGKSDQAIDKLESARNSDPRDVGLAFQLGVLYYQADQMDKAQREFGRAKGLNPNYSNARYMLGLVYSKQGQNDKAIEEFEKVLELNPDNEQLKKILENLRNGKPALDSIQTSQPPVQENPSEIKAKNSSEVKTPVETETKTKSEE